MLVTNKIVVEVDFERRTVTGVSCVPAGLKDP